MDRPGDDAGADRGKVALHLRRHDGVERVERRDVDLAFTGDRITFTFSATQKFPHDQVLQNKSLLESIAQQATGKRLAVTSVQLEGAAPSPVGCGCVR